MNQLCRHKVKDKIKCHGGLAFNFVSAQYILGSNLGICEPKLVVTLPMSPFGNTALKQFCHQGAMDCGVSKNKAI